MVEQGRGGRGSDGASNSCHSSSKRHDLFQKNTIALLARNNVVLTDLHHNNVMVTKSWKPVLIDTVRLNISFNS